MHSVPALIPPLETLKSELGVLFTQSHASAHAHAHAHARTPRTRSHTHARTHARTHTYMHTRAHTQSTVGHPPRPPTTLFAQAEAQAEAQTCTHARTYTDAHTHTNAYKHPRADDCKHKAEFMPVDGNDYSLTVRAQIAHSPLHLSARSCVFRIRHIAHCRL